MKLKKVSIICNVILKDLYLLQIKEKLIEKLIKEFQLFYKKYFKEKCFQHHFL